MNYYLVLDYFIVELFDTYASELPLQFRADDDIDKVVLTGFPIDKSFFFLFGKNYWN